MQHLSGMGSEQFDADISLGMTLHILQKRVEASHSAIERIIERRIV